MPTQLQPNIIQGRRSLEFYNSDSDFFLLFSLTLETLQIETVFNLFKLFEHYLDIVSLKQRGFQTTSLP